MFDFLKVQGSLIFPILCPVGQPLGISCKTQILDLRDELMCM